jgi:hypothetical protein
MSTSLQKLFDRAKAQKTKADQQRVLREGMRALAPAKMSDSQARAELARIKSLSVAEATALAVAARRELAEAERQAAHPPVTPDERARLEAVFGTSAPKHDLPHKVGSRVVLPTPSRRVK